MVISLGIILLLFPSIVIFFIFYFRRNEEHRTMANFVIGFIAEITFLIFFPLVYLIVVDVPQNDCCNDTASFSANSKLSIYVLSALSVTAYYIAAYVKKILPPIIELMLNTMLVIGFILSIVIHVHIFPNLPVIITIFCLPITFFFIGALMRRHSILKRYLDENEIKPENKYDKLAWIILTSDNKFIYLALLCFPVLFLIASAMLLFGQKPDAMISAFTDTYKHTFSQLDFECENVECGGHYLCSVAANGHKDIVKPVRYGERLGRPIICNRQLLVSNAFEELVWQKVPQAHKIIRKNYDKIGDLVHKYYGIFNNKYISDIVYVLMKPLEWVFLFILYCFDKNPENRIARQYLRKEDKEKIGALLKSK